MDLQPSAGSNVQEFRGKLHTDDEARTTTLKITMEMENHGFFPFLDVEIEITNRELKSSVYSLHIWQYLD